VRGLFGVTQGAPSLVFERRCGFLGVVKRFWASPGQLSARDMEAACAENRKRGFAMAGSGTKTSISLHQAQ
jgi:hypothetical protein